MKYLSLFFIIFLFACQQKTIIEVKNPSSFERSKEPVIIKIADLPKKFQNANIVILDGENIVPFQIDDLNNDGKPDEIFLQVDLKPREIKHLEINTTDEKPGHFIQTANIRFAEVNPPYREIDSYKRVTADDSLTSTQLFLMEGIGFENDKVAFRNYYDQRNGIDIFGKRTTEMVLDSVGIKGTNYHELSDWGMDILHVGSSLGAGAIAMKIKDTIFPVRNLTNSYYHRISDGPLRAIFVLDHQNVSISDRIYDIKQKISIYGGTNFYTDEISVKGLKGDEKLVTGIVNLHSDSLYIDSSNEKYSVYYTHAIQSMDTTFLGMGIIVSKDLNPQKVKKDITAKGIESTYMIEMDLNGGKAKYRFYSGWERENPEFKKRTGFKKLLIDDTKKFAHPVTVKIKNR